MERFNGDIIKFYAFWESFESAVYDNEESLTVDKFNYLHSLLDRAAVSSMQSLPLTEDNYENAVEILKDSFGRKQQIVSTRIEELLKLQNCPKENTTQLRQIYDKINIHVRGLKAQDVTSDQYGSLLIPVIMARIPGEIAVQIARETKNCIWSIQLKEILETLKAEVEAKEVCVNTKITCVFCQ